MRPSSSSPRFVRLEPPAPEPEEDREEEIEQDDEAGLEPVSPPEQKGGRPASSGLIDLPTNTPKLLGEYVKMLDNEYGVLLDTETGKISVRLEDGKIKEIPRFSEYLEGTGDGKKDRYGKKS